MLNNLSYNSTLNKYYSDETEITKEEFEYSRSRIVLSAELVERIRNGETVDVPDDIADIVEEQIEYLAEQDKERELHPEADELLGILTGEIE